VAGCFARHTLISFCTPFNGRSNLFITIILLLEIAQHHEKTKQYTCIFAAATDFHWFFRRCHGVDARFQYGLCHRAYSSISSESR
jgi:hypothetical protein